MERLHTKKKFHKFLYSPLAIVVLIAVLTVIVKATMGLGGSLNKATALADHSGARVRELSERYENLTASVQSLTTEEGQDVHYRKMGFAKPGEEVIVWQYEEPLIEATSTQEVSWWQELKLFFTYE